MADEADLCSEKSVAVGTGDARGFTRLSFLFWRFCSLSLISLSSKSDTPEHTRECQMAWCTHYKKTHDEKIQTLHVEIE